MTILEAMHDPHLFGNSFGSPEWRAWRTYLAALLGLPIDDIVLYETCTGGRLLPTGPAREAWVVVGRRGGKSRIAALVAVYLACFRDYRNVLAPGEVGTLPIVAADRLQARTVMGYVMGLLEGSPLLQQLVVARTAESVTLSTGCRIEIHTASFRALRGYTIVGAVLDEVAFWRSDDSANPDSEIVNAIRPAMATVPGALLMGISSPYARRGVLWDMYRRYYGKPGDVLVWQAVSRVMNPGLPQALIDRALEEDETAARSEYLAEFRRDLEAFVSREAIEACIVAGRWELPPVSDIRYVAFVDPSGGSQDAMTLAIAHAEGGTVVLDAVREVRPPFSPDGVVAEFAALLATYRLRTVTGDRYGGEWPSERFQTHGIHYRHAEQTKSELYRDLLPLVNAGRVALLDVPRLHAQLLSLERRTARGGRDSVDHAPGAHDDVANAVAGVCVLAAGRREDGLLVFVRQEIARMRAEGVCSTATQRSRGVRA